MIYNKLYIEHRVDNNHNIYWTVQGNDSEISTKYRKEKTLKYCNAEFNVIASFEFKDDIEAKLCQLLLNDMFKAYTNIGNYKSMQICISKKPEEFIELAKEIAGNRHNDSKLEEIFEDICKEYDNSHSYRVGKVKLYESSEQGSIYLVKCVNDKLKIGKTNDLQRRFNQLKECNSVKAIEIIDSFNTYCMSLDEARLHFKCRKYKCNSNGSVNYLQDKGNSELFEDCEEVMEIWNKYKESI